MTQAAYTRVVGTNPSYSTGDSLPVEQVSWREAKHYCEEVGGRLPTEAEWEYAARAGTVGARYGDLDAIAVSAGGSLIPTHAVGQKQPNAWNLYDMLGNVFQWIADWYGKKYYTQQENTDPQGPPAGDWRVLRGGPGGTLLPRIVRASDRGSMGPGARFNNIGVRCVEE